MKSFFQHLHKHTIPYPEHNKREKNRRSRVNLCASIGGVFVEAVATIVEMSQGYEQRLTLQTRRTPSTKNYPELLLQHILRSLELIFSRFREAISVIVNKASLYILLLVVGWGGGK